MGIPALQIQSKYIDDNPNIIDLKNARNANEVTTILNRINTTFGVLVSKFNQKKIPYLRVSDALEALTFCVDSQVALRCARSVSVDFNDTKRDRCFNMIGVMQQNIRDFQTTLIDLIDRACSGKMDKHLSYLATTVYRILSKIGDVTELNIRQHDEQMICIRSATGVADKNGYVSGPITVKLTLSGGQYRISVPDSPFVASEESSVDTAKDVQEYLVGNLSDFEYMGAPQIPSDAVLATRIVQELDVTDDSLDITLKPSAKPDEIVIFLQQILPFIKRAVNLPNTDVIHRVTQYGPNRVISFVLAKRKLYDARSLARVAKLLNVSKQKRDKLTSIMEPS